MRNTSALCSAVVVQAIMYIALGSFGIMSLTNLSYRGFVVAAIWAVIFANIYIWNGVESENIPALELYKGKGFTELIDHSDKPFPFDLYLRK